MARRVAAALVVLSALGVVGAALSTPTESGDSFTSLSNRGTPTTLELPRRGHFPGLQLTGEAFLIAEREDRRFYRLPQAGGPPCWATSTLHRGNWRVGSMSCQQRPGFPSREFPLQDFSPIEASLERPHPHYMWLSGIAADGVKQVAVIDADNRVVPATDVVDNVYFTKDLPKGDFFGLAALDRDGRIVWRSSPVP
jgi:hypothetical protein